MNLKSRAVLTLLPAIMKQMQQQQIIAVHIQDALSILLATTIRVQAVMTDHARGRGAQTFLHVIIQPMLFVRQAYATIPDAAALMRATMTPRQVVMTAHACFRDA